METNMEIVGVSRWVSFPVPPPPPPPTHTHTLDRRSRELGWLGSERKNKKLTFASSIPTDGYLLQSATGLLSIQ